jgi:hypothetical protein
LLQAAQQQSAIPLSQEIILKFGIDFQCFVASGPTKISTLRIQEIMLKFGIDFHFSVFQPQVGGKASWPETISPTNRAAAGAAG